MIRRLLAASFLLAVGGTAVWELVTNGPQGGPVTVIQTTSGQTTGTVQVPTGYVFVAGLSSLSGKTSAYFNHPTQGLSMLVSFGGQWKAFSATCTHAPCTVQYAASQIQCPCHGGVFNPTDGSVVSGPPPSRLPEFGVLVQNNNVFVTQAVVN